MTYSKFQLLVFLFFFYGITVSAQETSKKAQKKEMDSIQNIDWLSYNYQNLDSTYKITTTSKDFDEWKAKYRFKPGKEMTYADSLKVVLNEELENTSAARVATLRLSYTWDRASWSLLLNARETKELANSMGYVYPSAFIDDLRNPKIKNEQKTEILQNLKKRLIDLELEETTDKMTARKMMKLSFQYSPERLKVVDSILASQGSSRRKDN